MLNIAKNILCSSIVLRNYHAILHIALYDLISNLTGLVSGRELYFSLCIVVVFIFTKWGFYKVNNNDKTSPYHA